MAASPDPAPKAPPAADGRPGGRRRYPGARPFEDSPLDQQVFRGRAADVERLYQRVLGAQLLVLFSKSGLGKTSLLNAGLFPRLREKAFLPVPVRLNGNKPASQTVIAALVAAAARPGTRLTAGDTSGLWEYLRTTLIWRDGLLLTPVLVFDQFEEIFTLRDATFRDALAAELGALATGLPPLRLQAAGGLGGPAPDVKILLSLREEYLGTLQEISLAIPGLFQERVRLAPLADEDARQAIVEPAARVADPGDQPFKTPPFDYSDQALQAMLAFLRGDSKIIEPFQLQLLCGDAEDKLAARVAQGGKLQVSADDLGGEAGMNQVLRRFYAAAIMALPSGSRGRARRLCEEGLISATGRRLMLDQAQIESDFGLDADALALLVDERLLRRELRLESMFYEISHDRLADSINRQRSLRLPKRLRLPLGVAAVAAVALAAGGFWFTVTVRHERDLARDAVVLADLARDRESDASRQANAARETAEQARAAADKALNQASAARADADNVVSFLIGDSFLEKLRPVGRNEILEDVQVRVQDYIKRSEAGGTPSGPLTRGLALRNQADVQRSRGRLADAVTAYRESAAALATAPDGQADQARSLSGLSEVLLVQGKLGEAMAAERAAMALRADGARRPGAGVDALIELSESHSAVGRLLNYMGRPRQALAQQLDPAFALLQPLRKSTSWISGLTGVSR